MCIELEISFKKSVKVASKATHDVRNVMPIDFVELVHNGALKLSCFLLIVALH